MTFLILSLWIVQPFTPRAAALPFEITQNAPVRDEQLDKAIADRAHRLDGVLSAGAQTKLKSAAHDLLAMLGTPAGVPDPETPARASVVRRFLHLSAAQADLLTFYVMAQVAQDTKDADTLNKRAAGSTKQGGIRGPDKAETTRLLHVMDRGAPLEAVMRDLLAKVAAIPDASVKAVK